MRLQNKAAMQVYERLVKSFQDIIILKELKNDDLICGHEIRTLIYKRYHILIPSGTIYSTLYSMERKELIEGIVTAKKRVYKLTEKGRKTLENILDSSDEISLFTKSILEK